MTFDPWLDVFELEHIEHLSSGMNSHTKDLLKLRAGTHREETVEEYFIWLKDEYINSLFCDRLLNTLLMRYLGSLVVSHT